MPETTRVWSYAGFVSYSHSGDSLFAERLQRGVERFAKPWNRIRAVRLFRDDTHLTASPGLWTSITAALDTAEWFVLLVSPESAGSHWCGEEIGHWLATRGGTDHLLLVLTGGELVWEDGRFDPVRSTALPPALADAFPEEPLWIDARWARTTEVYDEEDPRLQRAVVDVAAAIRGLSKDELVGTAAREHRRTTRIKRAAQGSLATLLVLSIIATIVALQQRHTAIGQRHEAETQRAAAQEQATLAEARELAALSTPLLPTDLAAASTLAVAAYQRHPDEVTRQALFRAAVASPHFVGSYSVGDVSALPLAPGPTAVALGLSTGTVETWRPDGTVTPVFTMDAAVRSVAQSPDATVVAATDGTRVMVAGGSLAVPAGMSVHSVAVTPDGRFVWARGYLDRGSVDVGFDLANGRSALLHDGLPVNTPPQDVLVAPDDDHLVVFDWGAGFWASLSARTGEVESGGTAALGQDLSVTAMSANGRHLAVTAQDRAQAIQIWSADARTVDVTGPAEATAPTTFPGSLALSPSSRQVAVADLGDVYVAQTTLGGGAGLASLGRATLAGAGGGAVRFLDETHLVSVSHGVLTSWDLGQADRLGASREIPLEAPCSACAPPQPAVSDDGSVLSATSSGAVLTAADGRSIALPAGDYASPLWDSHDRIFVLPTTFGTVSSPTPLVRCWPAGDGSAPPLASAVDGDGRVVSVTADGTVWVQNATDGTVVDHFATTANPSTGAVSPDGTVVAVGAGKQVRLYDVAGHQLTATVDTGPVGSVQLAGQHLYTDTADGGLTSWDAATGAKVRDYADTPSYFARPMVPSPDGTVLARPRTDLGVDLVDAATGRITETLGVPGLTPDGRLGVGFTPTDGVVTVLGEQGSPSLLDVRDLTTDHLVDVVCAASIRDLTPDRWRSFAGDAPYAPPTCR